jgi:hypothetical protein
MTWFSRARCLNRLSMPRERIDHGVHDHASAGVMPA